MRYKAANGSSIKNYGEKELKGYNGQGGRVDITMQAAAVTKALGSVPRWVEADNIMVFDKDELGNSLSYIYNKRTGMVTKMDKRGNAYGFDLWVPRGKGGSAVQATQPVNSGKYHALMVEEDEEEDGSLGFAGLDDLM